MRGVLATTRPSRPHTERPQGRQPKGTSIYKGRERIRKGRTGTTQVRPTVLLWFFCTKLLQWTPLFPRWVESQWRQWGMRDHSGTRTPLCRPFLILITCPFSLPPRAVSLQHTNMSIPTLIPTQIRGLYIPDPRRRRSLSLMNGLKPAPIHLVPHIKHLSPIIVLIHRQNIILRRSPFMNTKVSCRFARTVGLGNCSGTFSHPTDDLIH